MGERLQSWAQLRQRTEGKWQIPFLIVAALTLVASLTAYRSPRDRVPFDNILTNLDPLLQNGQYTAALESAGVALQAANKSDVELAAVRAAMARARMLRANDSGVEPPSVARAAIDEFEQATLAGYEMTPRDHELAGWAFEWVDSPDLAARHYETALAQLNEPHLNLQWRLARLHWSSVPVDESQLGAELDAIISISATNTSKLNWAVGARLELLCDSKEFEIGQKLLSRTAELFVDRPWQHWQEYRQAYLHYRTGDYDQAERQLRAVLSELELRDELYGRTAWLLGKTVMHDDGPQRPAEAMTFFAEAASTSSAVYGAAGELGLAESAMILEQFEEGTLRYEAAIKRIKDLPANRVIHRGAIELSLSLIGNKFEQDGRLERGLWFAERAAELSTPAELNRHTYLLEQVAERRALLGRKKLDEARSIRAGVGLISEEPDRGGVTRPLPDGRGSEAVEVELVAEGSAGDRSLTVDNAARRQGQAVAVQKEIELLVNEGRRLLVSSGVTYREIAKLLTLDEDRAASAAWKGAEMTFESGDLVAAVEVLNQFILEHPLAEVLPRAFRYKGQALQEMGRYEAAIEAYQENHRRYPRTPDAAASLIPLARCYVALGKDQAGLAEKALRLILDRSEMFTPEAPEYADATFLLGDLLNRTGAYERAIPVLEEALIRYPTDERVARAQFLLGDCYLQSGMALKEDIAAATFAGARERLAADRQERMERAARLFDQMVMEYELREPSQLDRLDRMYLRHARMNLADCHFELGEYLTALVHYERAAWIYKGTTSALAAYVQIISCHVFSGQTGEASAAWRRAQYLVETLPEAEFGAGLGIEGREDWRRYFAWVKDSGLF